MAKIGDETVIFNSKPAEFGWRDSSLTGNGTVWAMARGAYANEEILLFHRDITGGGYTSVLQDVSDKFPAVRKAYADAKILDAEKVLSGELSKRGYKPQVCNPTPMCTLTANFVVDGFTTNYARTTDMETGEITVSYKSGENTTTRSMFAGRGSDVLAMEVSGSGKKGATLGIIVPPNAQNPTVLYEGGFVYFAARSSTGADYGIVARVAPLGGDAKSTPTGVQLTNTDGFSVFVKTFNDSPRDTNFKKLKGELLAVKPYDKLLSQHIGYHKKMFDTTNLSLGAADKSDIAMQITRSVAGADIEPTLLSRLFNFGKYCQICGVAPYDVALSNSAQLLYCGSTADILQDSVLAFFTKYEVCIDDLRKNAGRVYGMKGYFVPNVTSPKSALFGACDAGTVNFIASSALAANIFYRHYLLTGDLKTLKGRIFPFMREVCNFYADFLKLDHNGFYTTIPSYSPNSTPGNAIMGKPLENFCFAINSTIDFLAIGALLDNLIEAGKICGATGDIAMWQDMKTKIPQFCVNDTACMREYTNSAFIDKAQNQGSMHAYGLWPLKTLSFTDQTVAYQPAVVVGGVAQKQQISLRTASFNAVVARQSVAGAEQDARSIIMSAIQSAHAGASGAEFVKMTVLKLLSSVFGGSGLCLDTDWRGSGITKNGAGNFDVVGNVGFMNLVTECIVQSNQNTLRILPTLFDGIRAGVITDVATDFGARVSVEWDTKRAKCIVKITAPRTTQKINIEVNRAFKKVKNKELTMSPDIGGIKNFSIVAGKSYTIEFM